MNKKKKVWPLKHYINDKDELINQVFSCLSEKQIKRMIPTVLKVKVHFFLKFFHIINCKITIFLYYLGYFDG